jgi:tetratricopeptide (TPR) repeat protein
MPTGESPGNAFEEFVRKYGKPGEPDYHNNLGIAYRARGEWQAALREFREAVRLNPTDAMFHCNLASMLAQAGQPEEALREYEEALRLNPSDYETHFNLGNLLAQRGRAAEAMASFQRAIEVEPDRAEAYMNLANCYWEGKQWQEASAHYESALTRNVQLPAAAVAHLRLGSVYMERKSWYKAEKHLLQAFEHTPDDFLVNYCLAIVYLNIDWGEREWAARSKAVLFANKALQLDPKDEDAQQLAGAAMTAFQKVKPPAQVAPQQPRAAAAYPWWQFWKR